jgi:hypothetical protein
VTATERTDRALSNHLVQILRTYCYGLDPRQLDDLRSSIARGGYPWFREEFAAAVRSRAFTRAEWEATVGPSDLRATSRKADPVRAQQRAIWSRVVAGEPFPSGLRRHGTARRASPS